MEKYKDSNTYGNVFSTSASNFRPFSRPNGQEIYSQAFESGTSSGSKSQDFPLQYQQNPRKKRTKLIKIEGNYGIRSSGIAKPKYGKKPDPSAPKITKPCSECGKKFWSWKALFGHMRCHPERQWRGINPPPNFKNQAIASSGNNPGTNIEVQMTLEDHEVAACLLLLANSPNPSSESPTVTTACNVVNLGMLEPYNPIVTRDPPLDCSKFECSSCKKVFGSHQALGGHRASHKNVKGCFAIHKNDDDNEQCLMGDHTRNYTDEVEVMKEGGHKCSICLRVFSSGQALGGHKRCHWEKVDEPSGLTQALIPYVGKESCGLDLNLPPAAGDGDSSSSYSSGLALDLRLGL